MKIGRGWHALTVTTYPARWPTICGENPPAGIPMRAPAPTRESFHLGRARDAYVHGEITLERFEELAAHVLAGGYLSQHLEPRPGGGPPVDSSNWSTA